MAFTKSLDSEIPQIGLSSSVGQLSKLKSQIQKNEINFSEEERLEYFNNLIDKIITWNPAISKQLEKFWKAQREIIHIIFTTKDRYSYSPMKSLTDGMKQANLIHKNTIEKIKEHNISLPYLYALFYSHISRVDTIEYEIKDHFEKNLKMFGLLSKYDANEIFSINEKVQRGNSHTTDVRAIRHALAHMKYTISESDKLLTIVFHNHEKGYTFDKSFTLNKFLKFIYDFELLYKSQYILATVLSLISKMRF